jgi:hypothetical protein
MAEKTAVKILSEYFNEGEAKKPLREFAAEIKALSDDEKRELSLGVCAITGDTLKVA